MLQEQLDNFCNYFLSSKKYQFKTEEFEFDHDQLIIDKILIKQGDHFEIADNLLIAKNVLSEFKRLFKFTSFDDPEQSKGFLKSIVEYFLDDVLMGRTAFNDAMMRIAVSEFAKTDPEKFISFAEIFKRTDRTIFQFIKGFDHVAPTLNNFSPLQLVRLYSWLYNESMTEAEDVVDLVVGGLVKNLSEFCDANPKIAKALYETCVLCDPQQLQPFHVAILVSNYNHDHNFLSELKKLAGSNADQHTLISCLSNVKFDETTKYKEFVDIVESIENYTVEGKRWLSRFYATILEHLDQSEKTLKQHCFERLLKLMLCNPDLVAQTIFDLRFLNSLQVEVYEILSAFIEQGDVPEHFGRMLRNMYPAFKKSDHFFLLLRKIALKLKGAFNPKDYSHAITLYQYQDAEECDENLCNLLIDDEGFVRYAATRLLNLMSITDRKRSFSCDLLKRTAIEQYKLVVSITQGFHEPEYIVPFIAPLLDSPFTLVRDLVLHRLEILIENYFSAVIDTLEACLDNSNQVHLEYNERLMSYAKKFSDNLEHKTPIKELDPRYNQSKYLQQYFQESRRKLSESLNKSVKENTLMSFLGDGNDIMLAKGGGFYISEENKVQPLSSIKTEMSLPREYYLAPERYDWEHRIQILENWKDTFTQWEAMILL